MQTTRKKGSQRRSIADCSLECQTLTKGQDSNLQRPLMMTERNPSPSDTEVFDPEVPIHWSENVLHTLERRNQLSKIGLHQPPSSSGIANHTSGNPDGERRTTPTRSLNQVQDQRERIQRVRSVLPALSHRLITSVLEAASALVAPYLLAGKEVPLFHSRTPTVVPNLTSPLSTTQGSLTAMSSMNARQKPSVVTGVEGRKKRRRRNLIHQEVGGSTLVRWMIGIRMT